MALQSVLVSLSSSASADAASLSGMICISPFTVRYESGILWGKATRFASAMMYMEPYQVADILVSINGQTFDDQHPFSSFDETRKGPYQAQVLRANDTGSLELIHLDIPDDIHFYCATL